MSPTPNPTEMRPSAQFREPERNLYCVQYNDCLNLAARKGWQDWTCAACAKCQDRVHQVRAIHFANDRRG